MTTIRERIVTLFDRIIYGIFGYFVRRITVIEARNANDVFTRIAKLRREGFLISLDVMIEDVHNEDLVRRSLNFYRKLLARTCDDDHINIVIKPTSLGLHAHDDAQTSDIQFAKHLRELTLSPSIKRDRYGVFLTEIEIDAESTLSMERTFRVVTRLLNAFPRLHGLFRLALPMHIRDLTQWCKKYQLLEHPIRIVKGAGVYNEDPSTLVVEKEMLRRYEEYFTECLARKTHPFIATMHDEKLLRKILLSAANLGFTKQEFDIQMLYGLWVGLGRRLLREGYAVRIYVPIVLPWCKHASDGYVKRRIAMFRMLIWKYISSHKG